jgi:hypothetical protein
MCRSTTAAAASESSPLATTVSQFHSINCQTWDGLPQPASCVVCCSLGKPGLQAERQHLPAAGVLLHAVQDLPGKLSHSRLHLASLGQSMIGKFHDRAQAKFTVITLKANLAKSG